MKVYLIHGFNVKDRGENTIRKLSPYFESAGYEVKPLSYLYTGLLRVRLCNRGIAYILRSMAEPGSIAVGHSNGCAIIHMAAEYGAMFDQVVYINPALNRKADLPAQIKRAHVWHSPSDSIVRLSSRLPGHIWGRMGAVGYRGIDSRYINYDKENDFPISSSEHSDVFEDLIIDYFGPQIVKKLASTTN